LEFSSALIIIVYLDKVENSVLLYIKKDTLEKLDTIAEKPFRIKEIKNKNIVILDLLPRSKIYSTINLEKI